MALQVTYLALITQKASQHQTSDHYLILNFMWNLRRGVFPVQGLKHGKSQMLLLRQRLGGILTGFGV